jgi:hypothetical protein
MLNGPLLPFLPEYPLAQLVGLIDTPDARQPLGVWVTRLENAMSICVTARGRCCRMLLSGDLGLLLARCTRVAVRQGPQTHVLSADALLRMRVLEVGTTQASVQNPERLKEIFPGAVLEGAGIRIPLRTMVPEVVLAECVTHGIRVTESRITYSSS